MSSSRAQAAPAKRHKRLGLNALRLAALVALAGLAVLFAVLNLDEVEMSWIVASWSTPLIVVIAAWLLIGRRSAGSRAGGGELGRRSRCGSCWYGVEAGVGASR